jgi:PhzF family phenazine biosynthesis protein
MFRRNVVRRPKREIVRVHVFTKEKSRGNPAALVRNFRGNIEEMQRLATRLDLPATIYLLPPEGKEAVAKLRFFTPTAELPMCGHGALAASLALIKRGSTERVPVETLQSKIMLARREDGLAQLVLPKAKELASHISFEEVGNLIGIKNQSIIAKELPNCIASVGVPLLFVALKSREGLFSLAPKRNAILDWTKKNNLGGIYVYTPDTIAKNSTFHARCFNPRFNNQFEDVATGAAAGALASIYSQKYKVVGDIIIEQGTILNKDSQIVVSTDPSQDDIMVGGYLAIHGPVILSEQEDVSNKLSM